MLRRCIAGKRWLSVSESIVEGKRILGADAFEALKIERKFEIGDDLKGKMKEMQKIYHPDKAGGEDDEVRDLFLEVSAKCNTDYSTLIDDYSRACLIVFLESGRDINCEERAEELADKLDDDFLTDMLETKIEMNENEDDYEMLRKIGQDNDQLYANIFNTITEKLAQRDWEAAEELLLKANYYKKIKSQLKELLPLE
eukprot:TRINITY_DN15475_c0_g1_i1.p2 TRINITY_DN15475_c0_g1~~TRINITY_DN15475_c0_g1_i1.p2  ORF type:complete len:215 (+),score=75.75 TRINITY_DN15475_c0_g1_i1:53-646(+)